MKLLLTTALLAGLLHAPALSVPVVVFDNGPASATPAQEGAFNISQGYAVANDFSLSSAFTLTEARNVRLTSFTGAGSAPATLDWALTQGAAPGGTLIASAINAAVTSTFVSSFVTVPGGSNLSLYSVNFSLANTPLQAGTTYWLQLSNGRSVSNAPLAWHESTAGNAQQFNPQFTGNPGWQPILVENPFQLVADVGPASAPELDASCAFVPFTCAGILLLCFSPRSRSREQLVAAAD